MNLLVIVLVANRYYSKTIQTYFSILQDLTELKLYLANTFACVQFNTGLFKSYHRFYK